MNGSPVGHPSLTPSERRVLSLAAIGCKRPCDIANRMSTSVNEANDHIHRALVKLGVSSLDEAVARNARQPVDQRKQAPVGMSR